MKHLLLFPLLSISFMPLVAHEDRTSVPAHERVYIGMVVDEPAKVQEGLQVRAVAPASPADKAGVCVGDVVLRVGNVPVSHRSDLRRVVRAGVCGECVPMEIRRGRQHLVLQVKLELRPYLAARQARSYPALGADKHFQPVRLPDAIRQEIRQHRRLLRTQLASLPDGFDPSHVSGELQAIRNLARDAHAARSGWMSGRAGEISVRFRDEEGSIVLYGANNLLSLELYDLEGKLQLRTDLNTEDERRSLPQFVLERLKRLP